MAPKPILNVLNEESIPSFHVPTCFLISLKMNFISYEKEKVLGLFAALEVEIKDGQFGATVSLTVVESVRRITVNDLVVWVVSG